MEGSYYMNRGKTLAQFPLLKDDNLRGSLVYYDGLLLNYTYATSLFKSLQDSTMILV